MANNSSELTYRKATLKDLPTLVELSKLQHKFHKDFSWYYVFKKNYEKDTKSFLKKAITSKKEFTLVAESAGEIKGFVHATIKAGVPILEWKKVLWINDVFVKDELRGKGVGKKLFDEAISFAQKNKIILVKLQTDAKNLLAENFYTRQGMEVLDKVWIMKVKQ